MECAMLATEVECWHNNPSCLLLQALGQRCLSPDAAERPAFTEIVAELERMLQTLDVGISPA